MNINNSVEETQLEVLIVDLQGNLRSKWMPAADKHKVLDGQTRLPVSTQVQDIWGDDIDEITQMAQSAGDPDGVCVPSSDRFLPVPWNAGHQQILCSMHELNGEESFADPRYLLKRGIEKLKTMGFTPIVAVELEFYLLDASAIATGVPKPPASMELGGVVREYQVYDPRAMDRVESVLQRIHLYASNIGLQTTTTISEIGPGQFEVNLLHRNSALAAADDAVLLKRVVDRASFDEGMLATFIAKPYSAHTGSGMHVHASLLDNNGDNYFDSQNSIDKASLQQGDYSKNQNITLLSAAAKLLNRLPESLAAFAPHANSYRRLQPGAYAPVRQNWGFDHRGVAVRMPETHGAAARVEHRVAGSDANPYFVVALVLESIKESIEDNIHPSTPPVLAGGDINGKSLKSEWLGAIDDFKGSDFCQNVFGERLQRIFSELKRHEAHLINSQVTDVELNTYLSRI